MSKNNKHLPRDPVQILCMGGGVQTTTILLLAIEGEYPRPDNIIYANLGWDGPAVERNIKWLQHKAAQLVIPFHVLTPVDIRLEQLNSCLLNIADQPSRAASIPLFTLDNDGRRGMLRRQCTNEYKIRPIDNYIRRVLLKIPKWGKAASGAASLWFGISTDEQQRKVVAGPKWKRHVYPLLDLDMSRRDCHQWLERHNYHHPARSSCIPCPYRSNAEWRYMRSHFPDEFAKAVLFDKAIRNPVTIDTHLYLHQKRIPLDIVDFTATPDEDAATPRTTECYGYCGT